jgi:hypothetical protein
MSELSPKGQSEINERLESLSNVIASLRSTIDKLFPALSIVLTDKCTEEVDKEPSITRCSCKMSGELLEMETSVSFANDKINNILERIKL